MIASVALGCVKASFLFFYKRVFAVNSKSATHRILVTLIVLVSLWSAAYLVMFLFVCKTNFFAIWGSTMDLVSHCQGSMDRSLSFSITDFALDVIIICLPVPWVSLSFLQIAWPLLTMTWIDLAVEPVYR